MKITIDTKEDSHDEIQKVLNLLSSLVGNQEVVSNQGDLFSDNSNPESEKSDNSNTDMFSMFNSDSTQDEPKIEKSSEDNPNKESEFDIPDIKEYI
jgi:hypothetical protein